MGQGLHTKLIQVAAQSFNIPASMVTITENATNIIPNTTPTAASFSFDLYGMAVLDACEQILARINPVRSKLNDSKGADEQVSWNELIVTSYMDRVNLSAHGFYKSYGENIGVFDWTKECEHNYERGSPFTYFTQGCACTEVEIDTLSGDSKVIRTDIAMDVGKSINPVIGKMMI